MKKALYEWEYEQYRRRTRNQRKRSKEQIALWVSVVVWAVVVVAVVLSKVRLEPAEGDYTAPPEIASEAQETAIVLLPREATVAENTTVEEGPELNRLPMIENATMTHYCPCELCCGKDPDHPDYGITASGREAEPYVSVAVDPFLIELGSTVYVDYGDGEIHTYRADDTGSAITGAKLDLCVSSHEEAYELGVKTVKVWYEQ